MTLRGLAAGGVARWFGREPVLDFVDWAEFERRVAPEHAEATREHTFRGITASIARARQVLGYEPRLHHARRAARGPGLAGRPRRGGCRGPGLLASLDGPGRGASAWLFTMALLLAGNNRAEAEDLLQSVLGPAIHVTLPGPARGCWP